MICPHCGEDSDDYIEPPKALTPEDIADLERRAKDGDWIASTVLRNHQLRHTSTPFLKFIRGSTPLKSGDKVRLEWGDAT